MRRNVLFAIILFLFTACGEQKEVLAGLDPQQSVEAVVTLNRAGIQAKRQKIEAGRGERYRVVVPQQEENRSLALLHEYRLPRNEEESIEEFTRPSGFAPNTPQMEALRLDYARGLRIERLLTALPGVVEAKVLIRSASAESPFSRSAEEPAGASVVLRFVSPTNEPSFSLTEVREIVTQSVPGLPLDRVHVRTSPVLLPSGNALFAVGGRDGQISKLAQLKPFVFRVPEEEVDRASVQIVLIVIAVCIAGGILGWVWGANVTRNKLKRRVRRASDGQKSFFLEASYSGEEAQGGDKLLPGKGAGRPAPSGKR